MKLTQSEIFLIGKPWKRSVGPIKREIKKEGSEEYPINIQKEGRLTGLVTSCIRTAF